MRLNPLLVATDTPPIPAARAWLDGYRGGHGPAIDLAQAVPGRPPPPAMLERLGAAAASPEASRYGPVPGDAALRTRFAAHIAELYGGAVAADDVVITAGCNQAFFAAAMALAGPGDAVLLPTPWYFNHKMTLDMLGVEARELPCRAASGFVPDPDAAERLIDGRVRAIALVSPNNPTGAVYPPEIFAAFLALCRRRGIALIADETYRDFLEKPSAAPHGMLAGDWRGTLIQLYSFSKAYGIPGHRVGALVADAPVVAEIGKIIDSLQICAPRPPQVALAWAIDGIAAWRAEMSAQIAGRRLAFAGAMAGARGWSIDSLGAYFAYVRYPGRDGSVAMARRLAGDGGVLTLPGAFFGPGQDSHLRFAFANVESAMLADLPARLDSLSIPVV